MPWSRGAKIATAGGILAAVVVGGAVAVTSQLRPSFLTIALSTDELPAEGGPVTVGGSTSLGDGTVVTAFINGVAGPTTTVYGGTFSLTVTTPVNTGGALTWAFQVTGGTGGGLVSNTENVYQAAATGGGTGVLSLAIVCAPTCTVIIDGNPYANGGTASLLSGTHTLQAAAGPGYTFQAYTIDGPVTISADGATLTVTSNPAEDSTGTLTADFTGSSPPPSGFSVVVGSECPGGVLVNGVQGSETLQLAAGTYPISCPATCSIVVLGQSVPMYFVGWASNGGVLLATTTKTSTTITVSGNGTLTALYSSTAPS